MVTFSPGEMESLNNMVNPVDENEEAHVFGSALNPATVMGRDGKKEIAKPNVAVEVKTYNRAVGGGAPAEQIRAQEEAKAAEER